jgi:hypothetical protein
MFHGGWRIEENVKRYLQSRPPVNGMLVLLHPMSYRFKSSYRKGIFKYNPGYIPTTDKKYVDVKATNKAHQYEWELSRQLLKDVMAERGIQYDEKEAKMQSLYSRHGKYASLMLRQVPKLCDALKNEQPELSNEDIKAKVLKECSKEIRHRVASPEELIQSCWPNWLT